MNQAVTEALSRYKELETNEKRALLLLAGFLTVTVLYLAVWSPILGYVESSKVDHDRYRALLGYLQSTEEEARQAAGSDTGNRAGSGQNLITTVSRTARSVGVSPSRIQPEGSGAVSVWFESVRFTQLMLWIERLDRDRAIAVRQISIEGQDSPGLVSARIVLRE